MRKVFVFFLSVTIIGGFYGCKKKNDPPPNTGNVMFVNGCPGANPGLDAKVDYTNVDGAANISFTKSSGYKYVKAGNAVNISYFITNEGTPVINQSVNISNTAHYTAFCGGLVTSPAFLFTTDDFSAPAPNTAKIRFVNLSKDTLSVTANATIAVIGVGVKAMQVTGFAQVSAGNYELKAGDPSNIGTVVTTEPKTMALAAGKIYTLMLTGTMSGTGTSALKLTLLTNN